MAGKFYERELFAGCPSRGGDHGAARVGGRPAGAEVLTDSDCLDCHKDRTLTTTSAAGREISLFVDSVKLQASVHKTNTCVSCHAGVTAKHPDDDRPAGPVNCAGCHEKQSQTYNASVHGLASKKGELSAATCSDCHDGHTVLPPTSPDSPLHFSKLARTCGACHPTEAAGWEESVHGRAVATGHRDAPTCTDCHSEHKIEGLKDSSSLKISADICSKCHASERLNTKYNLPQDRVKTFFESYHGLAAQYGSTTAANCGSCHGVHAVLPSSDPRSTINPAHLVETCGKCHPGATEKFAFGKIHVDSATLTGKAVGDRVNWWVRRIYLALIGGVIGGMLLHNGLLLARKMAVIRRAHPRPILRMDSPQRAQHAILAVSFIVLAISGFALKFPDSWVAVMLGSSESVRRWIHRGAGVVLLAAGLYHVLYVLRAKEGRRLVRAFWPTWKDVKDLVVNLKYLAGMSRHRAKTGRFGYAEKMEYWAVVWGTIIMGATGLMLWCKIDVTRFLPRWAVDVALTIHYYEAVLACLAIIVWHFYHVIFDPDVYPLNWACWDGRVSREWQSNEHPLETPTSAESPPVMPPGAPPESTFSI